jgi:hypothetical protein
VGNCEGIDQDPIAGSRCQTNVGCQRLSVRGSWCRQLMSLGGDALALNECDGAVDLRWRPRGREVSMFDVRCSGGACVFPPAGQLLLSPGVLAEQLDGKGFSVPTLSRFSIFTSLFLSPLRFPPSTLRLRGQTADANNSAESEKPQSCTTRRLAAVAACHWIEIVARRLLRLAAISSAAARDPDFTRSA